MEKIKSLKFKDLQNYALEPVSYYMKTFDDSFEGMGMHQHQYFEIMYAHSGGFTLEIFKEEESPQLKRIPIRPGQFIVLDGFTFHRIVIEPHTCAVIYNIEFDPKEQDEYNPFNVNSVLKVNFAAMFTETNFKRIALGEEGYAVVNDSHQVDSTFKELVLMLTGGVTSLEHACAVTIAELNLFTEISKCLETGNFGSLSYIRKTNTYIQENFRRKITIDQIAEWVGINKAYLQRQYKKYTGQTILESINTLRVQKATNLLSNTNLPIQQIALQVGFKNKNQLNYEFKKVVGIPPSGYKRSFLKNTIDHHYDCYDSSSIQVPPEAEEQESGAFADTMRS